MKLLQALIALAIPALLVAGEYKTRNLVLVTADGLRWQEVFRGIDPLLMSREDAGMNDAEDLRTALWGDSPEQRRQRLLPFLWNELAPKGVIFGNAERGAAVTLRNRHRFSYPGYSEILTGRPQDGVIDSNDLRPNPSRTVLEILRDEWKLPKRKVALFGSWGVFRGIGANDPESVFINAGYQRLQMEAPTERLTQLSDLQFDILTPWRNVRHDHVTFEMAIEYLRAVKPRVLYIALGETDDWAHGQRYDRVLEAARYFDACLKAVVGGAAGRLGLSRKDYRIGCNGPRSRFDARGLARAWSRCRGCRAGLDRRDRPRHSGTRGSAGCTASHAK